MVCPLIFLFFFTLKKIKFGSGKEPFKFGPSPQKIKNKKIKNKTCEDSPNRSFCRKIELLHFGSSISVRTEELWLNNMG